MKVFASMISIILHLLFQLFLLVQCNEVTVLHELELPAYAEFNLGTVASNDAMKIMHYERASIFHPMISAASMNMANLFSDSSALYHNAASVLWSSSSSQRSSCLSNFAMSLVSTTTDPNVIQTILNDILEVAQRNEPSAVSAMLNIGKVAALLGKPHLALQNFHKILEINPNHALAMLNIGNYYFELGDMTRSIMWYNHSLQAIEESDLETSVMVLNNMGQGYRELYQMSNAIRTFNAALELINDAKMSRLHDFTISNIFAVATISAWWKEYEITEAKFERGVVSRFYNANTLEGTTADCYTYMLTRYSKMEASRVLAELNCKGYVQSERTASHTSHDALAGPIRIGYLSYDWRNHPMGRLTQRLVTGHNNRHVTAFCFSYGPNDHSEERAYVEKHCTSFHDYSNISSDSEIAASIKQHDIDILVDLTSLTYKGRVGIALHKPAAIVVNYLGYPGTTGCNAFDYTIVDSVSVPVEKTSTFSEKLVFFPYTYQANSMPRTNQISEFPLLDGTRQLQLCSFNAIKKIEPNVFQVWMNILKSVPASVLVLLEENNYIKNNILLEAAFAGVHTSRIVFWSKISWTQHLQRIAQCDIVLDTFVYGAHTTASDVLWMGVPIISISGWGNNEMPSRVASSLVASIGGSARLAVADSVKEYESAALIFSERNRFRNLVSDEIRERRLKSALFNNDLIQAEIEKAFGLMINIRAMLKQDMHIILPRQEYFEKVLLPAEEISPAVTNVSDMYCDEYDLVALSYLIQLEESMLLRILLKACPEFVLEYISRVVVDDSISCNTVERLVRLFLKAWDLSERDLPDVITESDARWLIEVAHSINVSELYVPIKSEVLAEVLHTVAMMQRCTGVNDSLRYMIAAYIANPTWNRKLNIGILLQHMHLPPVHTSSSALRVTFYCNEYGNSWWPGWDPTFVDKGGLGGSEEAVVYLARALAELGYDVSVYGEMTGGKYGDVSYYHVSRFNVLDPGDIFIAWRYPLSIELGKHARVKYLWLHDILDGTAFPSNVSSYINNILVPSAYHASKLPMELQSKVLVLPHGIPEEYIFDGPNLNNVFIYGSSPNRGLEEVLQQWSAIRAAIPDAQLEVYYGFNDVVNARLARSMGAEQFLRWQNKMISLLQQDGVKYFGTVNHRVLSEAYARAGFVLYPTRFPETGCISMIKAMAMGALPISSRYTNSALLELTDGYDLVDVPFSDNMSFDKWLLIWREAVLRTSEDILSDTFRELRSDMKRSVRSMYSWSATAAKLDEIVKLSLFR